MEADDWTSKNHFHCGNHAHSGWPFCFRASRNETATLSSKGIAEERGTLGKGHTAYSLGERNRLGEEGAIIIEQMGP